MWTSHNKQLSVTQRQMFKSFRTQQAQTQTCALMLEDAWDKWKLCSEIGFKCWCPLNECNYTLKQKINRSEFVPITHYAIFCEICQLSNISTDSSRLQIRVKLCKSFVVYSSLKINKKIMSAKSPDLNAKKIIGNRLEETHLYPPHPKLPPLPHHQ